MIQKIKLGKLYPIVKSYALKGMLLEYSTYEELAKSRTLEEFLEKLRPTIYGQYITEIPKPLTSRNLEKIFENSLIDIEFSLIRYLPRPVFFETYFKRHIYKNMKTVLKAKALGIGYEEIYHGLNLRSAELLGVRDVLVKMVAEKDLEKAVETLKKTPFYKDISQALELYNKEKDPLVFEVFLDRYFYENILSELKKINRDERKSLSEIVTYELDCYLITASLRAKMWGLTSAEMRKFMLPQGINLSKKDVEKLIQAMKIEEVLGEISKTVYEDVLRNIDTSKPVLLVDSVEKWFRERLLKTVRKTFLESIFKQAVILSFIKLKEFEVKNLSAISFGIEYNIPVSEIMENVAKIT
ncbi:MAG: V-type ATPase subunit [Nitrososphaerota archaeon]|nr:V-type ATPase subunit [Candidatus Geocrenenecus dongiae]